MNIAMFTNVYKPFVGGVPVSIDRLAKSLKEKGHNVYIFAPDYPDKVMGEEDIIRCKLIAFYNSEKFDIPVADVMSSQMKSQFLKMDIDIVHVHHPFWMVDRGRHLARVKDVPVIFTYHTRYEEYLHIFKPILKTFKMVNLKKIKQRTKHSYSYKIGDYLKYEIVPKHLNKFMN